MRIAVAICLLIAAALAVEVAGYRYHKGETAKIGILDEFLARYETHSEQIFDFLYFQESSAAGLTPAKKGRLEPMLRKYAPEVYFDAECIPERLKTFDITKTGDKYFTGYKAGGLVTCREKAAYPLYFSATYQISTGDLTAMSCKAAFIWRFNQWCKIWESCMWVNR